MEQITKKEITPILISYLTEKKWTNESLAEELQVDSSSISKWKNGKSNIKENNYKKIILLVEKGVDRNFEDEFCDYLIIELDKLGFDKSICEKIMNYEKGIFNKIDKLIKEYHKVGTLFQQRVNVFSIISQMRSLCHIYTDYIKISDQRLEYDEETLGSGFGGDIFDEKQDVSVEKQQNYLVLNFPNSYRVAVVLSNISFDNIFRYGDTIQKVKEKNNIDLILIYTDNEVRFEVQKYYIEECNLFFECIKKRELNRIKLQNISMSDVIVRKEELEALFYAQVVFERLTAYFSVIKNEIIFCGCGEDKCFGLLKQLLDKNDTDIYRGFVDKILLKEVYKYSYLSRHIIYFERARIREQVEKVLKDTNKEKLGIVVELCYPNSFLSSYIYDKCENVYLFTSSYCAHRMMQQMNRQSDKRLFPDNVQINLSHINPQYISSQYKGIIGKVDLVILGFGMGSSLGNLTEYLRHINSWLSPEGMLFLSLANEESIILKKQLNMNNIFETVPLFVSDYWQYTARDNSKYLTRVKRYNIEEAKKIVSTFVEVCEDYTYPFLSGFLHYDEKDRMLMDEIRNIDKGYSMKHGARHGHFINLIGKKNDRKDNCNKVHERNEVEIYKLIINFLEEKHIEYDVIQHDVAIDTQNLMSILIENGHDETQFDLIKTVVLCRPSIKEKQENEFEYVILPREYEINLEKYSGHLVWEKEVVQMYGHGNVSALVILPSVSKYLRKTGTCYFGGVDNLTKEYIIISAGVNTVSLRIKRSLFLEILNSLGVNKIDNNYIKGNSKKSLKI